VKPRTPGAERSLGLRLGLASILAGTGCAALARGPGWESVAVGDAHACAIREQRLYCWGENEVGALGIGAGRGHRYTLIAYPVRRYPARVAGRGWSSVRANEESTCGIRRGRLYCWGDGSLLETLLADEREGGQPARSTRRRHHRAPQAAAARRQRRRLDRRHRRRGYHLRDPGRRALLLGGHGDPLLTAIQAGVAASLHPDAPPRRPATRLDRRRDQPHAGLRPALRRSARLPRARILPGGRRRKAAETRGARADALRAARDPQVRLLAPRDQGRGRAARYCRGQVTPGPA
jgi:hypothetical protein